MTRTRLDPVLVALEHQKTQYPRACSQPAKSQRSWTCQLSRKYLMLLSMAALPPAGS